MNHGKIILILSVVSFCLLIAGVFLTGSTFGQRCREFSNDRLAYKKCIHNLAHGLDKDAPFQ